MSSWLKKVCRRLLVPTPASPDTVVREEWRFYLDYLRNAMVVFDVGANTGVLSMVFSSFVGRDGEVHAFEPERANYERLVLLSRASPLSNIHPNRFAVTDKKGTAVLNVFDEEHGSWHSLAHREVVAGGQLICPQGTEMVPATTIDDYCGEHRIDRIDLLKLDVEGAEFQVLRGAQKMLGERRVAACVFEIGTTLADMAVDPADIQRYLDGQGYCVRNVIRSQPNWLTRRKAEELPFAMLLAVPR